MAGTPLTKQSYVARKGEHSQWPLDDVSHHAKDFQVTRTIVSCV